MHWIEDPFMIHVGLKCRKGRQDEVGSAALYHVIKGYLSRKLSSTWR